MFSSCENSPEKAKTEQPDGDSIQDDSKDNSKDDSKNNPSGGGIWTPPVKE